MRRSRRWAVGAAVGAVVLLFGTGLTAWGLFTGVLQVNRPSGREFPLRGIDVSGHQGPIDWPEVRRAGFSFAYVKATEGGDWTDDRFVEHTAGARGAGLRVGAYHFFTFCRDGAEQGRHVVDVVRPLARPGDLPLVVDLEFGGNCSRTPTVAELDGQFRAFDDVVRAGLGRSPVLYVTRDFTDRNLDGAAARGSALAGHRLWIRSVVGGPGGGCGRWAFWQYADRGRVDGVDGPVDLDVYCGSPTRAAQEFGADG